MIYGLGAFLIALIVSAVLTCFLCPLLPVCQNNPESLPIIGIVSFLVSWWVAYIGFVNIITKKLEKDTND